ncbi:hypothetical protein ACJX0J_022244, partial [Zea mays]
RGTGEDLKQEELIVGLSASGGSDRIVLFTWGAIKASIVQNGGEFQEKPRTGVLKWQLEEWSLGLNSQQGEEDQIQRWQQRKKSPLGKIKTAIDGIRLFREQFLNLIFLATNINLSGMAQYSEDIGMVWYTKTITHWYITIILLFSGVTFTQEETHQQILDCHVMVLHA